MTKEVSRTKTKSSERTVELQRFLEKIVIDVGTGRASQLPNFEEKALVQIKRDIATLAGQAPHACRAKKSISGFKVREGQIVGVKVTLRRKKMIDFFERLITIVLPRVRDFGGLPLVNVDNGGVLNLGIKEQVVFPEINPEHSPFTFSLGISIVPRVKHRGDALALYRSFGVPLKKK